MKSKKKLFKFLSERFNKTGVTLGKFSISDETYGKKSCIYLWNISSVWGVTRTEMVRILKDEGFQVNARYGQSSMGLKPLDATEVTVSYFKGHHWDE